MDLVHIVGIPICIRDVCTYGCTASIFLNALPYFGFEGQQYVRLKILR